MKKPPKDSPEQGSLPRMVSRLIADVPSNWLDPLLTGDKAVIDHRKPMFTCGDIERLLNAIRARMTKTANESSSATTGDSDAGRKGKHGT